MISPNYFDYAAATPIDSEVLRIMSRYFDDAFFNPSAGYLAAQQVAKDLKKSRDKLARCIGVRSVEIIFTAGGTEANNLAIHGVMQLFSNSEMIVTAIEHDSVLEPAKRYKTKKTVVNSKGYVDMARLADDITDKTVLVSVMYANNEVGTIQPLHEVSSLINDVRSQRRKIGNSLPLYLHTDASQASNYLSLNPHSLGTDLMTINGGKAYGPKQSGALWVRTGTKLTAQVLGGGQERGLRSGTENIPGFIGLCEAIYIAQDMRHRESDRLRKIYAQCIEQLHKVLPEAVINGGARRIPNNIHLTIPGIDNETVMMLLDEQGFQVATGSACSASNDQPSHVLQAMGLDQKSMQSSLRITMGRYTTEEAASNLINALAKVYTSLA